MQENSGYFEMVKLLYTVYKPPDLNDKVVVKTNRSDRWRIIVRFYLKQLTQDFGK